ncbi:FtsX-like permease family protein [Metabacillus malikii]|uniref:ABC transport system permease protein n=1 Tax=Metabacillus malikii TaxID=1504265 RepID=A0ABT9ZMN5_9BACI|nr:FtsX-like permease family protein [Metabacillus malikii]MDQ0233265.1 putative ABC transport system permease protein [Metabacillus malikii]
MKWLLVKNDFKRNKLINLALFMFIMFSSVLAILSVIVASQTMISISELYKKAEPAHFLQMHKGDINESEIDTFMSEHELVTYWQTVTMLTVYGESLTIISEETYNLSDSRLDIGLVKQNETKDLLLNANHEKVTLQKGEIGMPILLKDMYGMEIGDHVQLSSQGVSKEFIITEFILDSMMNSPMASSTRILLSDDDFEALSNQVGEREYLIEAYFHDANEASDFQTAYENSGLPQNGQAITYTIIFILSALTDITTVFMLLLVSILLIIVSFICVKFTLMATLEEELTEIGTMKAIGIQFSDIRNLYLYKYRFIATTAIMTGYFAALHLSTIFTKHISATFGDQGMYTITILISITAGLLVFVFTNYYCSKLLKKLKKLSVVTALLHGEGLDKKKRKTKSGLSKSKVLPVNWLVSIRDVYQERRNWSMMFVVVLIAVLLILIPVNLMNTLKEPRLITYMGSSLEDILIEVENGENLENDAADVKLLVKNDTNLKSYQEYRRVRVQTSDAEGEKMNLHIDYGEKAGSGLQYVSGKAPETENEIAISYLNAEKIGKTTGDNIVLFTNGKEQPFLISGVYQDVTSGGYTAKATHNFSTLQPVKVTFSTHLKEGIDPEKKASEWSEILGAGVSVNSMSQFIDQTLGGVVHQLQTIVLAITLIGASLVMLVTGLYLKLRLAKDRSAIAVLKAIGFSEQDIKKQYMIKIGTVSLAGILTGTILTEVLDEPIINVGLSIAGLGIKNVELFTNPVITYLICPFCLLLLTLFITKRSMRSIQNYHIMKMIKE